MAYTINLTDGAVFAVIPDGTINTTSSMTLIGKNYAGYGAFLDSNFIHLLESGSNYTPPTNPLTGQLWWNLTSNILQVYNGTVFKNITGSYASGTAPTSNVPGDLWFNTTANVLSVYTGSSFLAVGPSTVNGTGTQSATILDTVAVNHNVIEMIVGTQIVAIVSKDQTFTPATPIPGFTTISPGITLATSVSNVAQYFNGTATNALSLGGVYANSFMRTDSNTSTTGTVSILNNNGLSIGSASDYTTTVNAGIVYLTNHDVNGSIVLQGNQGGTITNLVTINGSNSAVTFAGNISVTGQVAANTFAGNIGGSNANVTANSVSVTGNVTANAISATGNITASYFFGNGAFLTGISGGGSNYSNANVAAFLPTYSGAITAGTVTATGNISGSYILGNGALLSGLSGTYSNAVCAAYLAVYGGPVLVSGLTNSNANGVGNIGSSSGYFNQVFAQATTALYADVAERFAADETYQAGTVVELGGVAEITKSLYPLSENVFGVISTRPAHLMNGAAGNDETHPPVAMTGRVPVLVTGVIHKGDRLVSAGEGLARAAQPGEATAFNVIGRALHDKLDSGEGTVEAIVTIK
jgi:hypothetical protein